MIISKPHELAPHVAALFRLKPPTDMSPVNIAMKCAIELLKTVEPSEIDLSDPNSGIPYALQFGSGEYTEPIKSAANLLMSCLTAAERGHTTENERVFIPLLLASLADFVPDFQHRNSRKKRPSRSEPDALDRGLDDGLRVNPEYSWKELATWLEGEAIVIKWGNNEPVTFTDGDEKITIAHTTFLRRITEAKKRSSEA